MSSTQLLMREVRIPKYILAPLSPGTTFAWPCDAGSVVALYSGSVKIHRSWSGLTHILREYPPAIAVRTRISAALSRIQCLRSHQIGVEYNVAAVETVVSLSMRFVLISFHLWDERAWGRSHEANILHKQCRTSASRK